MYTVFWGTAFCKSVIQSQYISKPSNMFWTVYRGGCVPASGHRVGGLQPPKPYSSNAHALFSWLSLWLVSSLQSKLGFLTLFLCTLHGYLYGWNKFLKPSTYKWYTPPGYMLCLIIPSVVLLCKVLLLLPCVDRSLTRIRQGWERRSCDPGAERGEDNKATQL